MSTSALEHSKNFLKRKGLEFDQLRTFVADLNPTDALFLIGSIPDGLANSLSDVDILQVGNHYASADLVLHEGDCARGIKRIQSDLEINVEFWSIESINNLAEKISQIGESLSNPNEIDEIIVLDEEQVRIIHYIINGAPVFGNTQTIRDQFDDEVFIDYMVISNITKYLACIEDCIGQIGDSDIETAVLCLRYAVEYLVGSELASLTQTTPYGKWKIRLLKNSAKIIGEEPVQQYISLLFPAKEMSVSEIEEAISFCGKRIGEILNRRQSVLPAMAALGGRMQFVTSLQSVFQIGK